MKIPRKVDVISPGGGGGGGTSSKDLVYCPEYDGAVITRSGTDNSGGTKGMTSGVDQSGNTFNNYYEWISDSIASIQSYDVFVQIPMPSTFTGFQAVADALAIRIQTQETATTNNKVDVTIQKDGVATTSSLTAQTSASAGVWRTLEFADSDAVLASLAANDVLNIRLRMYSFNDKYARVGRITLSVVA